VAGLRIEQVRHDPIEGDPVSFSPRPAFAARSEAKVNPKVAVGWTVRQAGSTGDWTRLRFSAGTGFRPPSVFELAFTNNPDLKSERSRSIDVGVEQGLAGGAVVLEATAFFNRYDDLIVAVAPSLRDASQFATDNIANSRARGIEVSAAMQSSGGLSMRASYTWMATGVLAVDGLPDQAPSPFAVGDRLLRRPRHQGAIDAILVRGRGSAFARLTTRGNVLDVDPSFGAFGGMYTADGFATIDLGASMRLWRGVELLGRIENVADGAYEEALGFPAPGRRGMIGVRIASR
jgi:outer membrane receptor protein involved in Fe transport